MKVLIDINHPAHVHFFKHLYRKLKESGHDAVVVASKKDVTFSLLEEYDIPYENIGTYGKGLISKLFKLLWLDIKMFLILVKNRPDYVVGISTIRGAHASFFFKETECYVFTDTEHAKEQIYLHKFFADKIYTPSCFHWDLGKKQVRYEGYHELAYLHPKYFTPDKKILEEYGVEEGDEFYLLRFVSWDATHDIGQRGISDNLKERLIKLLSRKGKVFITSESPLPEKFEPYRIRVSPGKIHHLMYYAQMYIGEGGTMASEAAILGVPSLYVSTLVMGYINDLEKKYKLLIRSVDQEQVFDIVKKWLNDNNLKTEWAQKQEEMLEDKVDVTTFIYEQLGQ